MNTLEQVIEILTKEKERNLEMQKQHKKAVIGLPRGHFCIKTRNGVEYAYHASYEDDKKQAVFQYIGKDTAIVPIMQKQAETRRQLEKELRELTKDLEAIERMIKIANKRVEPIQTSNLRKELSGITEENQIPNDLSAQKNQNAPPR